MAGKWSPESWRGKPVQQSPDYPDPVKLEAVRGFIEGIGHGLTLAKGQVIVANPENWMISEGKLYVFGSPAPLGPVLFQKDLAGNIAKANQNRPILPKL